MRQQFLTVILTVAFATALFAQTTITYQGKLESGGQPFNGTAEMTFELHEAETGDTEIAVHGPVNVEVSEGLFQEDLSFGAGAFDGDSRYLQIIIDGAPLAERHPIRPSPMAFYALEGDGGGGNEVWLLGGNLDTDPSTDFLGTVDETPFEIRVDGQRALHFQPADNPDFAPNLIAGHEANSIEAGVLAGTIAGGGVGFQPHFVEGNYGTVGGGRDNTVSGVAGTVSGGRSNLASGGRATVSGGKDNIASANWATVGGGEDNTGEGWFSTVAGGQNNLASGSRSTVGGGQRNTASGSRATVPGGGDNTADGDFSFAAGRKASAEHSGSFVWSHNDPQSDFLSTGEDQFLIRSAGGVGINTNSPQEALDVAGRLRVGDFASETSEHVCRTTEGTLAGCLSDPGNGGEGIWEQVGDDAVYEQGNVGIGTDNPGTPLQVAGSVISGAPDNTVTGENSFVSGGGGSWTNHVSGSYAFVAGGRQNEVSGDQAVVAGGFTNLAEGFFSAVVAGDSNESLGNASFVGGGAFNVADASDAAIAGGRSNLADGNASFVGGGRDNVASGSNSFVAGGRENLADGSYSFAAGRHAHALHSGAFVWSDSSAFASDFTSTADDQFLIRTDGGVGINTNSPQEALDVAGRLRVGEFAAASSEWVCRTPEGTLAECSDSPGNGEGGSIWDQVNSDAVYTDGYVGVGTSSPGVPLQVDGSGHFGFDGNEASGSNSFVTGGSLQGVNSATGSLSAVIGGRDNIAAEQLSVIAGGFNNSITGTRSFVAGGEANFLGGETSTVLGGASNFVWGNASSIAGGGANTITEDAGAAFVGGGGGNTVDGNLSAITGGEDNTAAGDRAAIAGGEDNSASGDNAFVGGGLENEASGFRSSVVGGSSNAARVIDAFVGGGDSNEAIGTSSAVVGGSTNLIVSGSLQSFIGGGRENEVGGMRSAVVSGTGNTVTGGPTTFNAFIGGGRNNSAGGNHSAITGGEDNNAAGNRAAIAGGEDNTASGEDAYIGGGMGNVADQTYSAVVGGFGGWANGSASAVVGGGNNAATGLASGVVAGQSNQAGGDNSFVGGGMGNIAGAENTFVAGTGAQALHSNTFVWSGGAGQRGVESTAENQFVVAASGSVQFLSDENRTMGVELAPGGSGWSVVSDRHAKTAIEPADPVDVLKRVVELEVSEYSYKSQDESIRHMGPMAQDFYPLFGLGEDKLRVSAMNLAGIALAAIQGLNAELAAEQAKNTELRERLAEHEQRTEERLAVLEDENAQLRRKAERNAELEDRLAQLEALLLDERQVAEAEQ